MKENIKFLVLDVDGTLTDGKIYMGAEGEVFKAFDVKDGCGIKDILIPQGIIPIIITARESNILIKRCNELNLTEVYQGCRDKKNMLFKLLNDYSEKDHKKYTLKNVAYCGDDILDLQCMVPIKDADGIVACPHDSVKKVRDIADYICDRNGGDGAVREFIEWLVEYE